MMRGSGREEEVEEEWLTKEKKKNDSEIVREA